jgi:hypothetical protein
MLGERRTFGPYLKRMKGIHANTTAKQPQSVEAQRGFRRRYMISINVGKAAPIYGCGRVENKKVGRRERTRVDQQELKPIDNSRRIKKGKGEKRRVSCLPSRFRTRDWPARAEEA